MDMMNIIKQPCSQSFLISLELTPQMQRQTQTDSSQLMLIQCWGRQKPSSLVSYLANTRSQRDSHSKPGSKGQRRNVFWIWIINPRRKRVVLLQENHQKIPLLPAGLREEEHQHPCLWPLVTSDAALHTAEQLPLTYPRHSSPEMSRCGAFSQAGVSLITPS